VPCRIANTLRMACYGKELVHRRLSSILTEVEMVRSSSPTVYIAGIARLSNSSGSPEESVEEEIPQILFSYPVTDLFMIEILR
jgi:hypothetical protein